MTDTTDIAVLILSISVSISVLIVSVQLARLLSKAIKMANYIEEALSPFADIGNNLAEISSNLKADYWEIRKKISDFSPQKIGFIGSVINLIVNKVKK